MRINTSVKTIPWLSCDMNAFQSLDIKNRQSEPPSRNVTILVRDSCDVAEARKTPPSGEF